MGFKQLGIFCLSMGILFQTAKANELLSTFFERYEFIYEQGELIKVRDKSMKLHFSLTAVVDQLRESHQRVRNTHSFEKNILAKIKDEIKNDDIGLLDRKDKRKYLRAMNRAYKRLSDLELGKISQSREFKLALGDFEQKVQDALLELDYTVIASPESSYYFYSRKVFRGLVNIGTEVGAAYLGGAALSVASHIFNRAIQMLDEAKRFHQRLFLYYLKSFSAAELKISETEHRRLLSSVYESHISALIFWESFEAITNWDDFGVDNWKSEQVRAKETQVNYANDFQAMETRLSPDFMSVTTKEGNSQVISLIKGVDLFSSQPALAYDASDVNSIRRERLFYELLRLGLSLSPLPGVSTLLGTLYISSRYVPQKNREGTLFAFYELENNRFMKKVLIDQNVNPFHRFMDL